VYQWELDGPARLEAESLPPHVRKELNAFMEAVVIVDPMQYQRYPGEPGKPMRSLHFGQHDEGPVTFLIYPPDELVLVVQIQWLGG
jgi:hypothetical protein